MKWVNNKDIKNPDTFQSYQFPNMDLYPIIRDVNTKRLIVYEKDDYLTMSDGFIFFKERESIHISTIEWLDETYDEEKLIKACKMVVSYHRNVDFHLTGDIKELNQKVFESCKEAITVIVRDEKIENILK